MAIRVDDNGVGLPSELLHKLTEPYVTTRAKGTGLGLAIVRKIMEDHGGELRMRNRDEGGASVELVFNRAASDVGDGAAGERQGPVPDRAAE